MTDPTETDQFAGQKKIDPKQLSVRGEKPEKYTIPLVMALLELGDTEQLRRLVGVKDAGQWANIKNDTNEKNQTTHLPKRCIKAIIERCKTLVPPVKFLETDFLSLPKEKLIERVPREHPLFADACRAMGLPTPAKVDAFPFNNLLVGKWVRLLIARPLPGEPGASKSTSITLVVENFEIRPDERRPENLIIEQIDFEFGNVTPAGTVAVVSRGDTVEIRIDYQDPSYPQGTFLGHFPTGPVTHILAVALDVHYNSRSVITKPVLFVRLDELFDEKKRYRPKDAVYKKLKSVFKKFIAFEPSRMEMTVQGTGRSCGS